MITRSSWRGKTSFSVDAAEWESFALLPQSRAYECEKTCSRIGDL